MEKRAYDVHAKLNGEISIKIIPGHFATKHSHVSHCIDMTGVKSELGAAKAAAKLLSDAFTSTPVDTIISLERMKMIGAFMADNLSHAGINLRHEIAVITPELSGDKILLRDNFLPYIKNKRVLLLTASATTGQTVQSGINGISYYGGTPVGAAAIFGGEFECSVPFVSLFGVGDVENYSSFAPVECPLCKRGVKVDAVVNSYGYSKIL
ncbi:MAG: orotate phosphoribosyltransferase [Clostridia bacterium]|nr:orotate phosphoribosyltransferase [Clostridia bacterium]